MGANNPSINVAVKGVYDRVYLLRTVFDLLKKNINTITAGKYNKDALIKRLATIVSKIDQLLDTCEIFEKYDKIVQEMYDKYDEYSSNTNPSSIIGLYIRYMVDEIFDILGPTLVQTEERDRNYKKSVTPNVVPIIYADEGVKQNYANFIPTDDYFAWNTVDTSITRNGIDKIFLFEDTIVDNGKQEKIYNSISIREPKGATISIRKHGHTGTDSPSQIFVGIDRSKIANHDTSVVDPANTFRDLRDGHLYNTVKIGTQTWMKENMTYGGLDGRIGIFRDNAITEHFRNVGRLYLLSEIASIVPAGWRLPTIADFNTLKAFAGVNSGNKLKAAVRWYEVGTDNFGFSALPNGVWSIISFELGLSPWCPDKCHTYWFVQESYNTSDAYRVYIDNEVGSPVRSNELGVQNLINHPGLQGKSLPEIRRIFENDRLSVRLIKI